MGKQETAKKTKSKENYLGESEGLITDASYVPPSISDTVTPTEDEAGSTGKVVEIEDDDDYDMLDVRFMVEQLIFSENCVLMPALCSWLPSSHESLQLKLNLRQSVLLPIHRCV